MSLEEEKRKQQALMDEADRKALEAEDPLLRLRQISGTNQLQAMQSLLKNSVYIIPGMVINGTVAQFYAKPNGGKTLFMLYSLIGQIEAGNLRGDDIFYVNEDDNFSGFLKKCEIAQKYGFSMVSSARSDDENLRDPSSILRLITTAARGGAVDGKVFIFDTLKRFCKVMDKGQMADFSQALRVITAGNGTVILLGHANKNLSMDGKLVYEGVGDVQADIDIQYAIYNLSERTDERQVIRFENEKDRGDIEMVRTMEYRKEPGLGYEGMLDSLRLADGDRVQEIDRDLIRREIHERYDFEVPWILDTLKPGESVNKTELVARGMLEKKDAKGDPSILAARLRGRDKLADALDALIGHDLTMKPGDKGAKFLSRSGTLAQRYQQAKDGE